MSIEVLTALQTLEARIDNTITTIEQLSTQLAEAESAHQTLSQENKILLEKQTHWDNCLHGVLNKLARVEGDTQQAAETNQTEPLAAE